MPLCCVVYLFTWVESAEAGRHKNTKAALLTSGLLPFSPRQNREAQYRRKEFSIRA
jgi:hypothetical protein